jgi:hypothetical protein
MNEIESVNLEQLKYKKIAKRFLKELGLYSAWVIYVETEKALTNKSWYKKDYIDNIFGETTFTSFLGRTYGIRFEATISDMFRYYIIKNNMNYVLKFPLRVCDLEGAEKTVNIDKCTGKISFKKVIWTNSIGNETGN